MARTKTKVVQKTVNEDGTAAADSLKPGSRQAMVMQVIQRLEGASVEDISQLDAVLAQIGHEADLIPSGAAAKNAASIRTGVKEDLAAVFGDNETLSEETREKIETLFEAAVNSRVAIEMAEKVESLTEAMDAKLSEVVAKLVEQMDVYTDYAAKKFFDENQMQMESSIEANIAKSFMKGLQELFTNHHINIPEDKMDLLEEVQAQLEEVKSQLNEVTEKNMELHAYIEESQAVGIFEEISADLNEVQTEKFKELCEGMEYADADQLKKKLETIKEAHFSGKKPAVVKTAGKYENELLSEDVDEKAIDPTVSSVLRNITRFNR